MEAIGLARLARWIGADVPAGADDAVVTSVSTDTRALRPGAVFFALGGARHDGAAYARQAFARGARAVVASGEVDAGPGRPVLRVACARTALAALAAGYRAALGYRVVAITGSAGKTTTKDLLHHLLRGHLGAVKAPASFNNDVGVPLTLLSADRATDVAVVEVGTSGPGEIGRLGAIARPDVAVITCIAPAHLAGLGSIEGVATEKRSLLQHLRPGGVAVLNADDHRLRPALREGDRACGLGEGVAWRARVLGPHRARLASPAGDVSFDLPVPGEPFLRSALLALAAADALGVAPDRAAEALSTFRAPVGRMQVTRVGGVTLVDDTYNANPASVKASLETFAGLTTGGVVVLGGMNELGHDAAEHHRAVGRQAAGLAPRLLVTVGDDAREVAAGARAAGLAAVVEVATADDVLGALRPHLAPGRAVLFKASRGYRLERAVAATRAALTAAPPRARAA